MKIIKGDLIKLAQNNEINVIIHGCNCYNTMGSGVAKYLRSFYPEIFETDRNFVPKNPTERLGKISITNCLAYKSDVLDFDTVIAKAREPGNSYYNLNDVNLFVIVNAYTQLRYASYKGEIVIDYDALRSCFKKVKQRFSVYKIAYPRIGAGLAGGDGNIISKIIDEELEGCDHTLVLLEDD